MVFKVTSTNLPAGSTATWMNLVNGGLTQTVSGTNFLCISGVGIIKFLDITGAFAGHSWGFNANGTLWAYEGEGDFSLTVKGDGSFNISGQGQSVYGKVMPFSQINFTQC